MLLSELITDINYAHKGNSRAPTEGSDKWNRAVAIINRKLREWAKDSETSWASLFEERTVGTFSTTQTVTLDTDVHKLSDYVYLLDTDDRERKFTVIKPQQRKDFTEAVYVSGDPKVLTFVDPISATDSFIGSDIIVPLYKLPGALSSASDAVLVDNTEWLTYAVAAELARNDPAKDDQFGNLIGLANELYQQMKDNNDALPYAQPFSVPVDVIQTGESW